MSDRIAVMFEGEIGQIGRPKRRCTRRPQLAPGGRVHRKDEPAAPPPSPTKGPGRITLDIVALGRATIPRRPGLNGSRELTVGIRPERMTLLVDEGALAERTAQGRVADAAYYGDMTYYHVGARGLGRAGRHLHAQRSGTAHPQAWRGRSEVGWAPESLVALP